MTKEKTPRKKAAPRPKKTKASKKDWSIVPLWTNAENGGLSKVNLPAELRHKFVERFGLMNIPNEAELLGWIEIQKSTPEVFVG